MLLKVADGTEFNVKPVSSQYVIEVIDDVAPNTFTNDMFSKFTLCRESGDETFTDFKILAVTNKGGSDDECVTIISLDKMSDTEILIRNHEKQISSMQVDFAETTADILTHIFE